MSEMIQEGDKFLAPAEWTKGAQVKSFADYEAMYKRSVEDPEKFWSEIAKTFEWKQDWTTTCRVNYARSKGTVEVSWFEGGITNITVNCLDRNVAKHPDKTAILWEGNEPGETRKISYRELLAEVCQFANAMRERGIKKGDRVALYMPMAPELAVATLACARIGAIHSVVFGGFSAQSLADRIHDSTCKALVTADGVYRGKKVVPLKEAADAAMKICAERGEPVETCFVLDRIQDRKVAPVTMDDGRDIWWHEAVKGKSTSCEPEWLDATDPLFILYTSGSTGKPKGVLHGTGGYMVYAATTFKYIFDHREEDIYWCTADIGWITGHSYIVYGPLLNGATTLMFEGIPTYPDAGRFWDVVEKHKVTVFYTAPTAIRALEAQGDSFVTKHDRSSLRLLGTVGEPINPAAWKWYFDVVGEKRCPIVDTWWQTETGGIMITPIPGAIGQKPGSATLPFFGIQPAVLDAQSGEELTGEASGVLVMKQSWPGQMRTVYGDHNRFEETYFSQYDGYYFAGDGCRRDQDGYYWITGRVDDVINVSGHRFGTAEIESALVSHAKVAESAVIGYPHKIKGEGIYAYVTLNVGEEYSDELKKELVQHVRGEIGAVASPDVIHWAPALPKTRSGKIMRRILRKISNREEDQIGDTSTLADPSVVDELLENRPELS